jgi:hypothetical protein
MCKEEQTSLEAIWMLDKAQQALLKSSRTFSRQPYKERSCMFIEVSGLAILDIRVPIGSKKVVAVEAMKEQRGSRDIAPLNLNLRTR